MHSENFLIFVYDSIPTFHSLKNCTLSHSGRARLTSLSWCHIAGGKILCFLDFGVQSDAGHADSWRFLICYHLCLLPSRNHKRRSIVILGEVFCFLGPMTSLLLLFAQWFLDDSFNLVWWYSRFRTLKSQVGNVMVRCGRSFSMRQELRWRGESLFDAWHF